MTIYLYLICGAFAAGFLWAAFSALHRKPDDVLAAGCLLGRVEDSGEKAEVG